MNALLIIIAALFADNVILCRFFGIETFFTTSVKKSGAALYGGIVTFVTVISGTLSVLLWKYVLVPLNTPWLLNLMTFAAALLTIAVICGAHLITKKISEALYLSFTEHMPMISTNCIVIGCVNICIEKSYSAGESILYFAAAGAGLTVALLVFDALGERLRESAPPRVVKGLPILLLTAAFAAMALAGFVGA